MLLLLLRDSAATSALRIWVQVAAGHVTLFSVMLEGKPQAPSMICRPTEVGLSFGSAFSLLQPELHEATLLTPSVA